jgi:hypothetical protein
MRHEIAATPIRVYALALRGQTLLHSETVLLVNDD